MTRTVSVAIGLLGVATLALSACSKPELPELPTGVKTIQGFLIPAEISRVRRGSHLLQNGGENLFYLESKTVNLTLYEEEEVTVTGTFEHNSDPRTLPVMVVTEIQGLKSSLEERTIPELGMRLSVPKEWRQAERDDITLFTIADMERPIVRIWKANLAGTTFQEFAEDILNGIPILVGRRQAIRLIDEENGSQTVHVDGGNALITIVFNPFGHEQAEELRVDFLRTLSSISFQNAEKPHLVNGSAASQGQNGSIVSGTGQPCGGPAGILCPDGFYCNVTDMEMNIGTCVQLQ